MCRTDLLDRRLLSLRGVPDRPADSGWKNSNFGPQLETHTIPSSLLFIARYFVELFLLFFFMFFRSSDVPELLWKAFALMFAFPRPQKQTPRRRLATGRTLSCCLKPAGVQRNRHGLYREEEEKKEQRESSMSPVVTRNRNSCEPSGKNKALTGNHLYWSRHFFFFLQRTPLRVHKEHKNYMRRPICLR